MADIHDKNEKILLTKLRNDDVEAFDFLYHQYSDKLYRFSFSLLKNEEYAREIIQETWPKS